MFHWFSALSKRNCVKLGNISFVIMTSGANPNDWSNYLSRKGREFQNLSEKIIGWTVIDLAQLFAGYLLVDQWNKEDNTLIMLFAINYLWFHLILVWKMSKAFQLFG
jgi:hypothetical protein